MITLGLIPDWQFSSDPAINPYAGPPSRPSIGLAGPWDAITAPFRAGSWVAENKTKLMIGAGVVAGLAVAATFLK